MGGARALFVSCMDQWCCVDMPVWHCSISCRPVHTISFLQCDADGELGVFVGVWHVAVCVPTHGTVLMLVMLDECMGSPPVLGC